MVGHSVDRLDAYKLCVAEYEHREAASRLVTFGQACIARQGYPGNLQLVIALIAPEPRNRPVRRRLTSDPCRDRPPLIHGILNRLNSERRLRKRIWIDR